jgi:hypothetical protein
MTFDLAGIIHFVEILQKEKQQLTVHWRIWRGDEQTFNNKSLIALVPA